MLIALADGRFHNLRHEFSAPEDIHDVHPVFDAVTATCFQNGNSGSKVLAIIRKRGFLNRSRMGLVDEAAEFEPQVREVAVGYRILL